MWQGNDETREKEDQLSNRIIGAAIEVHKELGPGLLESAYQACLARELELRSIPFEQQVPQPVVYKDITLDCGYRMDIVVDHSVVVEIKSVDAIIDVHEAQCITYLRFSGKRLCLLLNFNTMLLKDGIKRFVNDPQKQSKSRFPGKTFLFFAALCVTH